MGRAAAKCRWYECRAGSTLCLAARAKGRLFCRECQEPEARPELAKKDKIMRLEKLEKLDISPAAAPAAGAAGPETVGSAIARLRAEKGFTAARTARIAGKCVSRYYLWLSGKSAPTLDELKALDAAWGTDLAVRYAEQAGPDTAYAKARRKGQEMVNLTPAPLSGLAAARPGQIEALALAMQLAEALKAALKIAAGPGGQ